MLRILYAILPIIVLAFAVNTSQVNAGYAEYVLATHDDCGDINNDDFVDVLDAVAGLKAAVGDITLSPDEKRLGDLNTNARLDIGDANRTVSHVVGTMPTPDKCGPEPLIPLNIERAFPNLAFQRITNLAQPNDEHDLLFVTEQDTGLIKVFPKDDLADEDQVETFLNVRETVDDFKEDDNEEGLLGLVFDPDYRNNGYFYVYYSASSPRRSVVSRFSVMADDPDKADTSSEFIIFEIAQPHGNHNGGQLAFGSDGMLYIALGDGGSGGDPDGHGQNLDTLLGSILRLDVNGTSEGKNYVIPPDNPFVGIENARDEIWAYGLRNPWRFSFEPETGLLWAADVGQEAWEEVNIIEKGRNYGWNIMEGSECYQSAQCDQTGLELPVAEYNHDEGCSITGGYVYQGQGVSSLMGAYVFGDYCAGTIWGVRYDGETLAAPGRVQIGTLPFDNSLTSFGVDLAGELYILSRNNGIYRFVTPPEP